MWIRPWQVGLPNPGSAEAKGIFIYKRSVKHGYCCNFDWRRVLYPQSKSTLGWSRPPKKAQIFCIDMLVRTYSMRKMAWRFVTNFTAFFTMIARRWIGTYIIRCYKKTKRWKWSRFTAGWQIFKRHCEANEKSLCAWDAYRIMGLATRFLWILSKSFVAEKWLWRSFGNRTLLSISGRNASICG